ncbi:MAG: hypothetical protein ACLR23_21600 [Clostridia bacterium]
MKACASVTPWTVLRTAGIVRRNTSGSTPRNIRCMPRRQRTLSGMPGGHGDVPGVRLWERGEKQMLTLATPDIRRHICELITRAKERG